MEIVIELPVAKGAMWQCPPTVIPKKLVPEQIALVFVGLGENVGEGKAHWPFFITLVFIFFSANILNLVIYTEKYSSVF